MKQLKQTKNTIIDMLTNSIDSTIYELQKLNNINNGDISIENTIKLENTINELSSIVIDILHGEL